MGTPSAAVANGQIYRFESAAFPQFRFEYHPLTRKVYLVRVGVTPEIGELLAADVADAGLGARFAQTWLAGYRLRGSEMEAHGQR